MLHSCTMAVDVYHKINQFEAGNMLIRTPLNGDQYVHPSIIPSENACPEHIFSPHGSIRLILHPLSALELRMCSVLEPFFSV